MPPVTAATVRGGFLLFLRSCTRACRDGNLRLFFFPPLFIFGEPFFSLRFRLPACVCGTRVSSQNHDCVSRVSHKQLSSCLFAVFETGLRKALIGGAAIDAEGSPWPDATMKLAKVRSRRRNP